MSGLHKTLQVIFYISLDCLSLYLSFLCLLSILSPQYLYLHIINICIVTFYLYYSRLSFKLHLCIYIHYLSNDISVKASVCWNLLIFVCLIYQSVRPSCNQPRSCFIFLFLHCISIRNLFSHLLMSVRQSLLQSLCPQQDPYFKSQALY